MMKKGAKTAFLFPGQGAQYVGMGRDFAEAFPIAKETFEEADEILQRNLSKVIFEGPDSDLKKTKNSQPGIFVSGVAILRVLQEQFPDLKPQVCAGLSLGEYTAVHASGRLSFEEALRLVQNRADYMNDACEERQGVMSVVIGLDHHIVEEVVEQLNLPKDLWAANFNCPGQVVISGTPKGIDAATPALKERGARKILPLQVHGAFHSGLMAPAEKRLSPKVNQAAFMESDIELVMNVSGDFVKNTDLVRQALIRQVTSPVRWEQGVRAMQSQGVDLFVELGCGSTLTGMNKRIGVLAETLNVDKLKDLERLNEWMGARI